MFRRSTTTMAQLHTSQVGETPKNWKKQLLNYSKFIKIWFTAFAYFGLCWTKVIAYMQVTHIISSPDYFTKDSTGLTEVLKTAVKQLSDDMDMREKCNKLADMFMSYRQVGEMEVGKIPKWGKLKYFDNCVKLFPIRDSSQFKFQILNVPVNSSNYWK